MENIKTPLTDLLKIKYPIIMAPMFLVSNSKMVIEALKAGITGAIPALNYRTTDELAKAIEEIRKEVDGPIGINLIANKSNYKFPKQLEVCLDVGVDYFITSLGSPQKIIEQCRPKGVKVFCDVIDEKYTAKVAPMGPDAFIAVNNEAGGHLGKFSGASLITKLKNVTDLPIISAGGVGNGAGLAKRLNEGYAGISMGSPFIATHEADVGDDYKQAIVDYGAKDIVTTTKISGTPCTVINTPYVQKIGTDQNWLESFLSKNKTAKKYIKMLTYLKGMKSLEKAAFSATYKSVWCAGQSIEHVKEVRYVREIVSSMVEEFETIKN